MWKPMEEWKAPDGPKNGTLLLILMPNGDRLVAAFSGMSQRWICQVTQDPTRDYPVAWDNIPDVPMELLNRNNAIEAERKLLRNLEIAPLALT